MASYTRFLAAFAVLWRLAQAQGFTPPLCIGNITEFPECEKADSIAKKCSDLSQQETIDCFCTQELLNAYVGCKGEFRQCALGNDFDSESDTLIANWQDACGPYLPSGITTPEVAAATKTLEGGLAGNLCVSLAESCAQLSQSITACSSSHTKAAALTSCRCQPSLITLASGCDIDFRETCLMETVTRSNIFEFRLARIDGSLSVAASTSSRTSRASTSGGSAPTSLDFGPETSAGAAATTTSTPGGAGSNGLKRGSQVLGIISVVLTLLLVC
ncbi:hypothetical protein F5X68DRAFT_192968 [Plectosphaerella plurivora]|uniref:Extracellular membrane protein CFEM domain-containing protein n=1 Tax=Plectosphaerella plurivora TaxID=936078 RepID=A0A9P8V7X0_9PEZI|nr:hypothetical protein F5X68DRAFT_192968 [Plectosphaerella plurivora]